MIRVVAVDDKGRVVIPKELRKRLGLRRGEQLLLVAVSDDTIVLRKLDVRKLLATIAREVSEKGVPLEKIDLEVEKEADRLATEKIKEILSGH
ncbi:AbrB/MazE/SpoVT family DNA-binding domain-containing protein [Infirmifilum sp. NZ]|uniref:AbrB/MazE/SpoVT family DNA-binding domain-containing protein n=1 Tax=Infirmifilum sp. NZ TaxID=2926850 RepID=UPI000CA6EFA8|nr:AbrB/MazE/SpoVT family DNA-binding domain-containing protein [Infirmifilum sp. NZ]PLJ77387.1 MAG: hypothetical protein B7L53_06600 [Thermofilum sp. NZ13]UNQ73429.1 AbrB/MazE/SpoVT family DNA-binding domain-containing protein [Infirmifilum sp. NZ]